MPIYEYRCRECDVAFEKYVDGRAAVGCPSCGSVEVTKLLSMFGARTQKGFAAMPAGGGGGCCGGGGCGCH
jgi:putative FmdB family regulatory protein